jgi:ABC-type glycerol-3-phosphate transport system substrate-binding protein
MKNINITQTVLIGVSVIAIMIAVVMFSLFRGGAGRGSAVGSTVLWGTFSEVQFETLAQELSSKNSKIKNIIYVEKDSATIEEDLLRAIAEGNGPDLVILNEKKVIFNEKRITKIPFDSFPLRDYQETFLEEASLLITQDGLLGFPFLVDPLVMYYNKDLLVNAGFSKPPQTWTEVLAITPTLTQKDSSFNISKSAIALGSFDNINNAKEIYWMLVLQAGNPSIVREFDSQNNKEIYRSSFNENLNFTLDPAYAATNFFTQFSNPTKTVYSWNRSLPDSQTAFVAGDLAFYIGKASEVEIIKKLNPNLNFDVTVVPQSQSSTRKITYGLMHTLMIPRGAKNVPGAISTIATLTSPEIQKALAKEFSMTTVRKDTLSESDPTSPYEAIFNRSAIMAQGVLEPDSKKINDIIKELIDTVVSGQYEVSEAITRADQKISLLLQNE